MYNLANKGGEGRSRSGLTKNKFSSCSYFPNFETLFIPVRPCPISRTWLWCRRDRVFAWGRPHLWWTPGTRGTGPWQTAAPGTTSLPQTLRVRQAVGNDHICDRRNFQCFTTHEIQEPIWKQRPRKINMYLTISTTKFWERLINMIKE